MFVHFEHIASVLNLYGMQMAFLYLSYILIDAECGSMPGALSYFTALSRTGKMVKSLE